MSGTFVISSVTAGSQTQWGGATVENAALGIRIVGHQSSRISRPFVTDGGRELLSFDFTASSVYSGRFDFTDALRPFLPHGWDSAVFGRTTIENAAHGVHFRGIRPTSPSVFFTSNRPGLALDFVDLPDNDLALHFTFGGPQIVVGRGLDSLVFGRHEVESPLTIFIRGWHSLRVPIPFVSGRPGLALDFVDLPDNDLALHFTFDGPQIVVGRGRDSAEYGRTQVENAALGVFARGIAPTPPPVFVVRDAVRDLLRLDFNRVTYPDARNIPFNFGTDRQTLPHGWQSTRFGVPGIINILYGLGLDSFESGSFFVLREGEIGVFGFDSSEFGMFNIPRGMWGFDSSEFGVPEVVGEEYAGPQFVRMDGYYAFKPGNAFISNYWRVVYGVGGHRADRYGDLWVSFYERQIRFQYQQHIRNFGTFEVGYHQDVEMLSPLAMTQWGWPVVDLVSIVPEGFDALQVSGPWVSRSPRPVAPFSWTERAFGGAIVWNSRQLIEFVAPDTNPDTYTGVTFGRTWRFKVENVDRAVLMAGSDMSQFASSFADVVRSGRALVVDGFESHRFPPFPNWHIVGDQVRHLHYWGLDSFRIVTYHRVFNAARLLEVWGRDSAQYGRAHVWRYLQQVRMSAVRKDVPYGRPWVSFGQRTVQMRQSRQSLQMPHIIVGYTPLRVHMEGWDSFRFDNLFSFARPIPTITPRWPPRDWQDLRLIGVPRVWNVTPEIRVTGRSMLGMAETRHMVDFRVREIFMEGWDSFHFENLGTLFRNRELPMVGWESSRVAQEFVVIQEGDPVPFGQRVEMESMFTGFRYKVGSHAVTSNAIRMDSEDDSPTRFGEWQIFGHSIIFRNTDSHPDGMFRSGRPTITGGERVVEMGGLSESSTLTKFRLSPNTIWMTRDVTQQARQNHDGDGYCLVDEFCRGGTPPGYTGSSTHPWWGQARVWMEGPQIAYMRHASPRRIRIVFGRPWVHNWRRRVFPESWDSFFQGYPSVATPTDQEVGVWSRDDPDRPEWGDVVFSLKNRSIIASGWRSPVVGQVQVENQHRPVYMQGNSFTQYGNNTPMVYHYPRGFTPVDSDMTQWGITWVSHSPRWLPMDGLGSLSMEASWLDLSTHMRVWLWLRYVVGYAGFDSSRHGAHSVSSPYAEIALYGATRTCVNRNFEVSHV